MLGLLQNSQDETIRRVAAGAVANLAMNGMPSLFSGLLFCSICLPVVVKLRFNQVGKTLNYWRLELAFHVLQEVLPQKRNKTALYATAYAFLYG